MPFPSVRDPACALLSSFFFFNDTATTEIYTLSLHDALPICNSDSIVCFRNVFGRRNPFLLGRSEEHTSELQSRLHLVCRLLLAKKKVSSAYTLRGKHTRRTTRSRLTARR